jgi:cytochrome c-type biogenesis protein CcmH
MLWVGIAVLCFVALIPLLWAVRGPITARGRRESALALYRAQLVELGRDLDDGRIGRAEHEAAVLEVQRRLLAVANSTESGFLRGDRGPLMIALFAVPAMGVLLYLTGGSPDLPAEPLAPRMKAAEQQMQEENALIDKLKQVLTTMDPHSERAREGYVLLGGAEARMGNMAGAAQAWRTALAVKFDPTLAMEAGEATTEANGRVTDEAASLFRRALAAAPANAPWRAMATARLAQAGDAPSSTPQQP